MHVSNLLGLRLWSVGGAGSIWLPAGGYLVTRPAIQHPSRTGLLGPPSADGETRSSHALAAFPEGKVRCIACELCGAACPSGALSVTRGGGRARGGRGPVGFRLSYIRCILCS
jgi:NADH-quinone oxidoreductase subunit I